MQEHRRIMGTKGGPAIRPGSSMPTSNLLVLNGTQIVVDCGLGVTKGLVDQSMQLKNVSLIFITHLHSDQYLELGPSTLEDFACGADLLIHEAMLESALPALLARIGNGSDKLLAHWLRSHAFAHAAARTASNSGLC